VEVPARGSCSPVLDFPSSASPAAEFPATGHDAMLEDPRPEKVAPKLRTQATLDSSVCSLASAGTFDTSGAKSASGATEERNFDNPVLAPARTGSPRVGYSSIGELKPKAPERRTSTLNHSRLNWELSLQDRTRAKELTSQGSTVMKSPSMREMYRARMYQWLDWWMSLEEPKRGSGRLAKVALSKKFEALCALVILANAFFAAYTTNYEIEHLTEESTPFSNVMEWGFLGFYMVKLMLKFSVHRLFFFCNDDMRFNIFDSFLVLTSLYYQVSISLMSAGGIDLTYMRTLRILKLARILRVIRMARFFMELRLMLNSVLGSFISLFWAFVMLVIVFYIFGLVFVQGAATYLLNNGADIDSESLVKIHRTFGSVQRAMLSLYKATTGGSDWENLFDSPLIESMGWLNVALFIFLIAFIQVALLNILTGVFVENALKLAQPDRDTLALEHRRKELVESQELREICMAMDRNESGTIDPQEFFASFRAGKLRAHLEVLGLHIKDADVFFQLLMAENDTTEQELDIDEFVAGCMRLRGSATSLDLQTVLHCIKVQTSRFKHIDNRLNELANRMETSTLVSV